MVGWQAMARLALALGLTLGALLATASAASAHVCVLFLVSITGPHLHVLC